MFKILLLSVFCSAILLSSANAKQPEWVRLTEAEGITVYYDSASVFRDDYETKVWFRYDQRRGDSSGWWQRNSFNCEGIMEVEEKVDLLSGRFFHDDSPWDRIHVRPGSIESTLQDFVCKRYRPKDVN